MPRTKPLNRKVNIKQASSADLPLNPVKYVTARDYQVSASGQTVINLGFSFDVANKDALLLLIDGKLMTEGASNDYTVTNIQSNNTSNQLTLTFALAASLNIQTILVGIQVQSEPNVNSLQAQITALGGGTGTGSVNYIASNSSSGDSVTGWATYADAAAALPVDGTGGSPALTFAQSSSSPLRGSNSFLITKDAANRQGQGASYDFTIDRADLAKVISIDFDYEVSTNYVDADMVVYVYDVTNAQMTQPAPYTIVKGTGTMKFKSTFQTSSNSTSYRLIFHVASVSALAYTMKLDRIVVGPTIIVQGTPVTDWAPIPSAAALLGNFGSVTQADFQYRRVGDTMEIKGSFLTGTTSGSAAYLQLPFGMSMDSTKLQAVDQVESFGTWIGGSNASQGIGNNGLIGTFTWANSGTDTYKRMWFVRQVAGTVDKLNTDAGNTVSDNVALITLHFRVPILGWSSQVQMSQDTDTRIVNLVASSNAVITGGAGTTFVFPLTLKDTHGAYNAATGVYTVPVPGDYQIGGSGWLATVGDQAVNVQVNNVFYNSITSADTTRAKSAYLTIPNLKAGDQIKLVGDTSGRNLNYNAGVYVPMLFITRISGPAQIAASESVNCSVADSSTALTATPATVTFSTKDYDSHGAMNAATGTFTAPTAGLYRLTAFVLGPSVSHSLGNALAMYTAKNGALGRRFALSPAQGTGTYRQAVVGSTEIKLLAGETLQLQVASDDAGSIPSGANNCSMQISKVG